MKKKKIIAQILKVLIDNGIQIKSPYDVENFLGELLTHSNMFVFFYRDEEEINVRDEIKKYL
jgi:hypothetical protein